MDALRKLCLLTGVFAVCCLLNSCALMVSIPETDPSGGFTPTDTTTHTTYPPPSTRPALKLAFPFEDITNWWRYSMPDGNQLEISVVDTISDDGITYYKVRFAENNKDTTMDWYRSSATGVDFGSSLIGTYYLFLPASFSAGSGSFESRTGTVYYNRIDTLTMNTTRFRNLVRLSYNLPLIHGFDSIEFADSVGLVRLTDNGGRFPAVYTLDSSSIGGVIVRY